VTFQIFAYKLKSLHILLDSRLVVKVKIQQMILGQPHDHRHYTFQGHGQKPMNGIYCLTSFKSYRRGIFAVVLNHCEVV